MFDQSPYPCRLEWGRRGAREAAERGDILVIVDVLSFSSAVVTAVRAGGQIRPCLETDDAERIAREIGGELAVPRRDVPDKGRFSLSPATMQAAATGTRIAIASLNGATCSCFGRVAPALFVGALLNARATAQAVTEEMRETGRCVSVVACGERWQTPGEDGELRMAIEDYLGAGAILTELTGEKSPEAQVCEGAFRQMSERLEAALLECGSGRELRTKGYADDVRFAAQWNVYDHVARMRYGFITRAE